MEFSQGQDLCFGGDHADLLRQEFEQMDREFHTPSSSPVKRQSRGEASSDQETDLETDSESECLVDYTDKSPMDKKEEENVIEFLSKSCGCTQGSNKQACSKQFTKEHIPVYRNNCLEMSRSELDLVILTAIMCSRPPSGENCRSARARTHEDILVSSFSFPLSLEQSPDSL